MIQRCSICGLKLLDAMGNDLPPGRPFDPGAVVRVDSAEPPAMMVVRAEQEGPLPFDSCIELCGGSMVKFTDGPAAGQCLGLHRAPIFLRVVQGVDKKFDALDHVDDEPRFTERIFVYIRTEYHGMVHICRTRKAGGSGFFAHATYKHFETQPGDDVLRNNFRWQRWAHEQHDAIKKKEDKPCDGQESPTGA